MAQQKTVLSIIMCMHSDNPFMEKAFESMTRAVAGLPVETILVANGGYRPMEAVAARFDKQVTTAIGGLGYARNRGVEEAEGEFITFFDADDLLERTYVERQLEAIASGLLNGNAYAFSATKNVGPADEPIGASLSARMTREPNRTLWFKHPFTGATLLIRREHMISIGGYKWSGYAEDYELSVRLRERFGPAVYLGDNHYIYRLHGAAMSSSVKKKARGVMHIQLHAVVGGKGPRYAAGALVSMCRLAVATVLRK